VFVYTDLGTAYGSSYTQGKAQNLVDFLAWIVNATQGQTYSEGLYYIPLASAVISADLVTIAGIHYNGAKLTACVPSIVG